MVSLTFLIHLINLATWNAPHVKVSDLVDEGGQAVFYVSFFDPYYILLYGFRCCGLHTLFSSLKFTLHKLLARIMPS